MSDAVRDLVADALPHAATWRDLGTHRLKDLGRGERVWQLCHPDVASDFPPLRSLSALPTNLPVQLSSFVGRSAELEDLRTAIGENRLVTLTGAGGCGKTRLAFHTAADIIDRHTDGVWLVELASVVRGEEICQAIGGALGLREEFGREMVDTLADQLRDLDVLLVLDNCEQVLDASAAVIGQLLQAAPRLRVLATSREPLGVPGEYTWRVPSLDVATAVELFVERAQHVRAGFAPDAEELATIAQISERLDGIPLAIELAAARTRMMHPVRIAAALDDRFRLLTGGSRTVMPRQQTLEASVAWSYDLLDDDERALLCRLSVLHGFMLEAAEAVCADDLIDRFAVLELLGRLVDKSLVYVDHSSAEVRYRLLETVRQFVRGRLVERGETDAVRRRHFDYFLELAERAAPELPCGGGPVWLARLQLEHDNLDAALEWAAANDAIDSQYRMLVALTIFYEMRAHFGRAGRAFARTLDAGSDEPSAWRARALWGAAHVALYGDDFETAMRRAPEALAMADTVGDTWAKARALNTLGYLQLMFEPEVGRALLEEGVALGRANDDRWAVADCLKMISVSWFVMGDEAGAQESLEELRRAATEMESAFFVAWYHAERGAFALQRGAFAEARAELDASWTLCQRVGDPSTGGLVQAWLAAVEVATGEYAAGEQRLATLLSRAGASGGSVAVPEALVRTAEGALACGDLARAIATIDPFIEVSRGEAPPYWVAWALALSADAHRRLGEHAIASAALAEAAEGAVSIDNPWLIALVEHHTGRLARDEGDANRAEDLQLAALGRQFAANLLPDVASTLDALAALAVDQESFAEAVRLCAVGTALRAQIGLAHRPIDHDELATRLAAARSFLGDEEFTGLWETAAHVPLGEVVEYAARARGERKRPSVGWDALTPTEARVVALVADGLTNPQIAERMFVARGTVKVHLSHVFAKLGVATRAELAGEAARREALSVRSQ